MNFIIFVASTTRMAIEHLPFLTLLNAGFGPGGGILRAKISILQGEEREMFDCHPSCSRCENDKIGEFCRGF